MRLVKRENAEVIKNSDTSSLLEYSTQLNDKEIDFAINSVHGRYPETGYCSNKKCKELAYILEGTGKICKRKEEFSFQEGDVILIEREEVYFWKGNCKIIMICTPAWYKEQCELMNE